MNKQNIENYLNMIIDVGSRAPGSWGELKAAELIKSTIEQMGVEAELESFPAASHLAEKSLLLAADGTEMASLPCMFSPAGKVEGELVFIGNCQTSLVKEQDLSGKIGLLTPSGDFQERIKFILDLEKRGLEALIVVCPAMDSINTKIIRYPEIKRLPNVAVSFRTANQLKKQAGQIFKLTVEHGSQFRNESVNVVAKINGSSDRWLAVSTHIDTTPFSVGANDNAGGCALQLELLRQLAIGDKPDATIYFLFSGSEENGGLDFCGAGAEAFFSKRDSAIDRCIAHVFIDDIGNSLWPQTIWFGGNKNFKKAIRAQVDETACSIVERLTPSCDFGAAIKRSIPYVWFNNAAFPRPIYHTPEDTADFFDLDVAAELLPGVKRMIEALVSYNTFFPFITDGERLLRPARFSDMPDIKAITRLAFEPVSLDRMAEKYFNTQMGEKDWFEYKNRSLEEQCKANIYNVIVCEIAGRVVGYATMSLDDERGIAEIGNNAVHPEFQGKGIGKMMQQEIMRRMKENGFEKFKVNTLSNDIAAQKVYEKLGFEKIITGIYYLK